MTNQRSSEDEAEIFFDLLKSAKVGMLVTGAGGQLKSRPMRLLEVDQDGMTVRMFTKLHTMKDADLAKDSRANISVMDGNHDCFISLSGTVAINQDNHLIHRLWKPIHLAWFPEGPNDSELAVLEFNIEGGDYWDAPGSKIIQTFGIAKAILTRTTYDQGEHGHVGMVH